MSLYLILNIAIIIFPLLLTFEGKIKYYRKLPSLLFSIVVVGLPFIIWDMAAAARGDWAFNPEYTSGPILGLLPVEEILFFITVPYAIVFLFETINYYVSHKTFEVKRVYLYTTGAALLAALILVYGQYYTFTIIGFALILIVLSLTRLSVFNLRTYWIWIGFSFIPFMIFNSVLTSLPVVSYSDRAILGYRAFTVPVEDFLYSFTLLTFYLTAYLAAEKKWNKIKTL